MPILGQVGSVTLASLVPEVCSRLENRQDGVTRTRAASWLADTLLELTGDARLRDDFDELEVWGTPFLLEAGTQEYPFANFLIDNPGVEYNQATLDVLLWTDVPAGTSRIKLYTTHYQDVDRATLSTGAQPSEWYRFGDSIGFNPVPDNTYQVRARILKMHPIEPEPGNTALLLSREWWDVLEWGAVERGFMELQQFDKAGEVHKILHGDPENPGKPGLWGGKHTRRQKEAFRQSTGLRPIIRPYGWGRR